MHRRDFLRSAGIVTAGLAWPGARSSFAESALPDGWRTFEIVTRAEVLEPVGTDPRLGPGAARRGYSVPEDDRHHVQGRGRNREARPRQVPRLGGDGGRGISGRGEAGADGDEPRLHAEPRRGPRRPPTGAEEGSRDPGPFPPPYEAHPHRRRRARQGARDRGRGAHGRGQGACDLRMDRREHLPRSQGPRLRARRHPLDAGEREPGRQVRGPQCPLCRARPRLRPACPRRLRHPHREVASSATRASGRRRRPSPRRSTAGPRCISPRTAGCPSIPRTCARSRWRSLPATGRSTTRW